MVSIKVSPPIVPREALESTLSKLGYKKTAQGSLRLRRREKAWRLGHQQQGAQRDAAAAVAIESFLRRDSVSNTDVKLADSIYKGQFKRWNILVMTPEQMLKMPAAIRQLDAAIYAHRIFPTKTTQAKLLATRMQTDPTLHQFLRCNYVHVVLESLRQRRDDIRAARPCWNLPEPRLTNDGVEFPVVVNGARNYQRWNDIKQRFKPITDKTSSDPSGTIYLGTEGDLNGAMINAWLTYQGIHIKPKDEALNLITGQPLTKERFLECLQAGFVEADVVPNNKELECPVFSVLADSRLDKPVPAGVHGLFMISVPDQQGNLHRFTMGLERTENSFALQAGRPSLLDIRHYRTWSGRKDLVRADIKLEDKDLPKIFAALLDFRKEADIYEQMHDNCCTVLVRLLGELGIEWDVDMHVFEYLNPRLAPPRGRKREKLVNIAANLLLYFFGAGNTTASARKIMNAKQLNGTDIDRRAHFSRFTDIFQTNKAYMHSPFKIALRCQELNHYQQGFGNRYEEHLRLWLPTEILRRKLTPTAQQIIALHDLTKQEAYSRHAIDRAAHGTIDPKWIKIPQPLVSKEAGEKFREAAAKLQKAMDEKERIQKLVATKLQAAKATLTTQLDTFASAQR